MESDLNSFNIMNDDQLTEFFYDKGQLLLNKRLLAYACFMDSESELERFFAKNPIMLKYYNLGYSQKCQVIIECFLDRCITAQDSKLLSQVGQTILFKEYEKPQSSYDDLITQLQSENYEPPV